MTLGAERESGVAAAALVERLGRIDLNSILRGKHDQLRSSVPLLRQPALGCRQGPPRQL